MDFMESLLTNEYSKTYDRFKASAAEHMSLLEDNKNPDLNSRYPEIYTGNEGDIEYSLQLSNPMTATKDLMTIDDKEVKVVARFWKCEKAEGEKSRSSICYNLGEDGKWYSLTSDKPRFDVDKNTTFWKQNSPKEVDKDTFNVEIKDVISRLKKPTTKI